MKKTLLAAIAGILLMNCGGNNNATQETTASVKMKPATTEVSGDMSGCFTVVDREYKVNDGIWSTIIVEISRTGEPLPFVLGNKELWSFGTYGSSAAVKVGFGIEFLDEEGNILSKTTANSTGYSHEEPIAIVKLKENGTGSITFSLRDDAKEATQFRITSAYEEQYASETSDEDEYAVEEDEDVVEEDEDEYEYAVEEESASSGSKDWDSLLDSYEQYVDKYISYMKKAANGDMSALTEYPSLMEKAQELSEEIQNAQGEMSTAQWSRYMKITNKMSTAAQ